MGELVRSDGSYRSSERSLPPRWSSHRRRSLSFSATRAGAESVQPTSDPGCGAPVAAPHGSLVSSRVCSLTGMSASDRGWIGWRSALRPMVCWTTCKRSSPTSACCTAAHEAATRSMTATSTRSMRPGARRKRLHGWCPSPRQRRRSAARLLSKRYAQSTADVIPGLTPPRCTT